MINHANWTAAVLVTASLGLLGAATGCMSEFQAYRATLTEDGQLRLTDPEPVPLPSKPPKAIPVYWKDREGRTVNGIPTPRRPYEVIGRAQGVVGIAWQMPSVIDDQFRRAAAALNGDAIIDAKRTKYLGKGPANEYTGRIIKWKPAAAKPRE